MNALWPSWTDGVRTSIFRLASLNKGSKVLLGEDVFRVDEALRRVYIDSQDSLSRALHQFLTKGDVFLDIGANIGLYSLIAASKVFPEGTVYAFEPDPINFRFLKRNVELNKCGDVISSQQIALGEEANPSGVTFYVSPISGGGGEESSLIASGPNTHAVTVPLDTLDNFCFQQKISPRFIKIDTEGAELPIIHGGAEIIKSTRPILAVEYHGGKCQEFGYTVPELWACIESMNYRQTYLMKGEGEYFMTRCIPE